MELRPAQWHDSPALVEYRLAIFDFDGTLADTLPWIRSIFNDLAVEHGFRQVQAHEYPRLRDLPGAALLRELQLPLWKLPRVLASLRRRMAEHRGTLTLFPEIDRTLQRLAAAGLSLALVSSNSRENIQRILGPANAAHFAHFGCGVSMFGKAARLRQALRQCRVAPSQAIYIGDEIRDAEAARQAGVAFGAVTWGQHSLEALRAQHPAAIFLTVPEIAHKLLAK